MRDFFAAARQASGILRNMGILLSGIRGATFHDAFRNVTLCKQSESRSRADWMAPSRPANAIVPCAADQPALANTNAGMVSFFRAIPFIANRRTRLVHPTWIRIVQMNRQTLEWPHGGCPRTS